MALLLTLGCTSKDLLEIFSDNGEFLKFFDGPDSGLTRAIRPNDWAARKTVRDASIVQGATSAIKTISSIVKMLEEMSESASIFSRLGVSTARLDGATLLALWLAFSPIGAAERNVKKLVKQYPFLAPILNEPLAYASNLLYDRGLFPGFAMREFLAKIMKKHLPRHPRWRKQIPDPSAISFLELKDTVGLDLVVVGTNLSQHRAVYFSAQNTPNFRVIEAVGISASFPIVFKPVWIEANRNDHILGELTGYWADGGILNNIPLHAFDEYFPPSSKASSLLNPAVLALALRPGAPQSSDYPVPDEDDPLANLALDLLETALMPAGPGQYAARGERDQVIDIFSYSLSLFDFAPSESASKAPRTSAFNEVIRYFTH